MKFVEIHYSPIHRYKTHNVCVTKVTIDKFGYCAGGAVDLPVLLAKWVGWHFWQCLFDAWFGIKKQVTAFLLKEVGGCQYEYAPTMHYKPHKPRYYLVGLINNIKLVWSLWKVYNELTHKKIKHIKYMSQKLLEMSLVILPVALQAH